MAVVVSHPIKFIIVICVCARTDIRQWPKFEPNTLWCFVLSAAAHVTQLTTDNSIKIQWLIMQFSLKTNHPCLRSTQTHTVAAAAATQIPSWFRIMLERELKLHLRKNDLIWYVRGAWCVIEFCLLPRFSFRNNTHSGRVVSMPLPPPSPPY